MFTNMIVNGHVVCFPTIVPSSALWFDRIGTDIKRDIRECSYSDIPSARDYARRILASAIRQQIVQSTYYDVTRMIHVIEAKTDSPDRYGNTVFLTLMYNVDHGWATAVAGHYDSLSGHMVWECYAD